MKKLCKHKRQDVQVHVRSLALEGGRPKFICTLCGRASSERGQLCEPLKIRKNIRAPKRKKR